MVVFANLDAAQTLSVLLRVPFVQMDFALLDAELILNALLHPNVPTAFVT